MPIDPSIALQIKPLQFESPLDRYARASQIQGVQNQNRLADLVYSEKQRGIEKENALTGAYKAAFDPSVGRIDTAKLRGGLGALGDYAGLQSLDESEAAQVKADLQLQKDKIEMRMKQIQSGAQIMGGVRDQRGLDSARQQIAEILGTQAAENIPAVYSPDIVNEIQMRAMSVSDQAAQKWKEIDSALSSEKFAYQKESDASGRAVTIRGQDLTSARAREAAAAARENAAAVRGEKATAKQIADDEKAINKFSATIQKEGIPEIETALSGVENVFKRYQTRDAKGNIIQGDVPGIGAVKNVLPSAVMSEEGKDVRQALASVRNIVLSARSGAAVTDQELRRLIEEIGTGAGMSVNDISKGLAKIRARLESIKTNAAAGVSDDVLNAYRERGGLDIKRGSMGIPSGWSVKAR